MQSKILCSDRIRKISGSFAFIEHRFLRDGFFNSLTSDELKLYLFLILAANKEGVSWYDYDKICRLLKLYADEYITARNGLIDKDLIAFGNNAFQVLSLPPQPIFTEEKQVEPQKRSEGFIHISEIFKNILNRPKPE